MNERTAPAGGEWAARPDPPDPPVVTRGPFRQGLGTRIADYERWGTEDFLAGEYRASCPTVCPTCRVPPEHCLCAAEPGRLRYALAKISVIHQLRADGACAGRDTVAALCGYLTLLDYARAR